jgi:hypothetical protein
MRLHVFQMACIVAAVGPGVMPVPKSQNFRDRPPPFRMKRWVAGKGYAGSTWRPKHRRNRKGRDPHGRSGYFS